MIPCSSRALRALDMADRVVQSNGICKGCQKQAGDFSFPCASCEKIWHVVDCTGEDLVTKTCLQNMLKPWKANGSYPCVCFVCPPCRDAKNLQRDMVASNRMTVVEEGLNEIKLDMKYLKDNLMSGHPRTDFPPLPKPSKPSDFVLVVKKPADKPAVDRETIKQAVLSSRAAVSSSYVNKSGDTVMVLDNEAAKDRLAANIREKVNNAAIVFPTARMPTIRITGMDENHTPAEVFTLAKNLNSDHGITINENNFKVLFVRKHAKNANKFQATVRVSNEIRSAIQNNDNKLYVGLNLCPIYDHFHIKRCNRCQGYNHYKEGCTKDPICGKCTGPHDTETCQVNNFKCVHCVANKFEHDHKTSDTTCKSYQAAQKKLEQSIGFYKEKNSPPTTG